MNEVNFYKTFNFNVYKFYNYHLTDNTKSPVPNHYLGYLIKGTAKIKTNNTELSINPNEIFYIPKGLKYQSQWYGDDNKKIEFYSFGFEISPINNNFVLQKVNCNQKAKEIFYELCNDIYLTEKPIGKLYYFFSLVSENMKKTKHTHINPIIEKAVEFMTNNTNFKIADLARYCNISEPSIYLLFKRHLKRTPNEVRNRILCDKAISLLTTTNKPVQEISDILNFSSTSYFRKILKAHTGKTPLEIRKESTF